ncbi:outer membrane receptor protein involved in Fe transport [Sphingomonas leidyi]|uniref:Outer membrane receptor protein involved in Fe transport n=1 Tax=Sphingomonas leidyi TaxID=68569 RepID=A0A7X5V1U9_9SPHN|nr:TonB-dependent receptor [Sphingomonas leidyi]NIJ65995.1 outer membrane receptor protein involved in Fe transport [Sphingomonas leidyi]
MGRFTLLVGAGGAVVCAMAAPGAAAQDRAPPEISAASGQDSEIIVTATRRNERLQDVAGAVSALTGDTLERLRAKSLADFAAYTPGVSFETTTPSTNKVVIRGITTGGTQLNSAIGLYLDDVPIGSSTPFGFGVQAINLGMFDLRRIEVLNGPQGTLFGANALGGTLRYITEIPVLDETRGRIEGEAGYTAHGDANLAGRAMLNLPFGDRVALRATGLVSKDAGYADDPAHNRRNLGDARTLQGRASLLFQATPDLSIRLNGYAQRIRSNGNAVVFRDPVTHRPTGGVYDQSFALEQPSEATLYVGSAVIDWMLGFAKLTSITAYQKTTINSIRDFTVPYSAILRAAIGPAGANPYGVPADVGTKRFTQEVRLASGNNKSFEWVVGGFYSNEDTLQNIRALNAADPQGKLLGLTLAELKLPSTAREFALFANGTVYFTSTIDATIGVRQSWNDQVFTTNGVGLLVNSRAPTTPVTSTGESNESVRTYLFNLRYRPTARTLVYGRIASGYRPGGPNLVINGVGTGSDRFEADTLWNYELGLKHGFGGGRGFFNISGYHIDWTNIQQVRNVGGINQLVNAGNARINGVESALSYRVVPGVSLLLSGAYTDAKLTTAAPALGVNHAGARIPLSPRVSIALAGNYDFDLGDRWSGTFNLGIRHIGERTAGYAGSAIAPLYKLAAYSVVDATLSLRTASGWEIGPYVKNVFDRRGEVSASTVFNQYVPGTPVAVTISQPRTFGLVVGRNF